MKTKRIDFVRLLKPYKKGWVAISMDYKKVVLHSNTLQDIVISAKNYKQKLYFFPTGEKYSAFVGKI